MSVPTSCCRGWWVAGRPANKHMNSSACHCSSIVSFYDHWKDSEHWPVVSATSNHFRRFEILTQNVKKVPFISSDIFVSFLFFTWSSLHPAPQYLRAWLKIYVFCHWLKSISIFFSIHVCWTWINIHACLSNPEKHWHFLKSRPVCPAVIVLSVDLLKDIGLYYI